MTYKDALQFKHNDKIRRKLPDHIITGHVIAVGKKWLVARWDDEPEKVDYVSLDDVGNITVAK